MHAVRASRLFVVIAAVVLTGCRGAAPSPGPQEAAPAPAAPQAPAPVSDADQRLAAEVESFLDSWLVQGDATTAVAGRTSSLFADEQFEPAGAYSPEVYRKRTATIAARRTGKTVSPQQFQDSLTRDLASKVEAQETSPAARKTLSLQTLLAPYSPDVVRSRNPQLWTLISSREPRLLVVAGIPALAYRVRTGDDISWTAIETVGFQLGLADLIASKGVNAQAVVTGFKGPADATPPALVTLWSDEGSGGKIWRYFGSILPNTQ